MKMGLLIACGLVGAATATASIQMFFTAGSSPYGLTDPNYAFIPANGNHTDIDDGNWRVSAFPPAMAPTTANVGETVYIWLKFAGEPNSARINVLHMNLHGPVAECAWYVLDDMAGEMATKRWDGDYSPGAPEFKVAHRFLNANTSYGLLNLWHDNAGWLYQGGTVRTYLLGAVRYDAPGTYGADTGDPTMIQYAGFFPVPIVEASTVTIVPEPAGLTSLGALAVLRRRR